MRSRSSHTAKIVSFGPMASRLARCTASAPRSAYRLARSPAWVVMASVNSTVLVAPRTPPTTLRHGFVRPNPVGGRGQRRLRRRAPPDTRGLDTAASQPSHSAAARSLPSSSTTSLTKAAAVEIEDGHGVSGAAHSPTPTPGRLRVPERRRVQRADNHGLVCSARRVG